MKKRDVARVFWSGRSQAIRLPKEYRLSCREVRIRREGSKLVIEPTRDAVDELGWPVGFFEWFATLDAEIDLGDRARPAERKSPLE